MQRVRRAMLGWPLLALPGLARAQAPSGPATDPGEVIPLWPRGPPGGVPSGLSQRIVERGGAQGQRDRAVSGITRPTLTVFRPPNTKGRGCVLVVPGGGYERVLLDREGFEIARWLSRRDITAYVLTYRLPGEGWAAGRDAPLQDVQRAIRMIRERKSEKVCALGFSAGGHLVGQLGTRFERLYTPVDRADRLTSRPDMSALIYPVISMRGALAQPATRRSLLGDNPSEADLVAYSLETRVGKETPPTFLAHAQDDRVVPVGNTLAFSEALKAAGIASHIRLFREGGHGFGMRGAGEAAQWPQQFLLWARGQGL